MNDAFERLRAQLARCPAIQAEAAALYPGIGLLYLSIPQLALPADRGAPEALLLIHGCRAGQAVWELGSGGRIYLNPGDFAVCPARGCTEAALSVPAGGYEGVTLCVDLREAAARPPEPLGDTDLFSRLADQFGGTGRPVFLAGNAETRGIFASFYGKPEPVRRPYQRIKAWSCCCTWPRWSPSAGTGSLNTGRSILKLSRRSTISCWTTWTGASPSRLSPGSTSSTPPR